MRRRMLGPVLAGLLLIAAAGSAVDAAQWAWLGVRIRDLSEQEGDEISKRHGLREGFGVLIIEVMEGTPAEKAGVKQHDVFVELDGKRLTTVEQLTNQVQEIKDRQVAVKFVRGGKEASVQVAPELDANSAERYWYALNDVHQRRIYDAQAYHRFKVVTSEVADDTQPEAQLSRLKQQLHEIQLTVERLEASLGKAPPSKTP